MLSPPPKKKCPKVYLPHGDSAHTGVKDAGVGVGSHLAGEVELGSPPDTIVTHLLPAKTQTHTKCKNN